MRVNLLFTALMVTLIIMSGMLRADVPRIINYQGRLTDSGGDLTADGNYLVKFTIWSHETSSDPGYEEWTSDFRTITITNGLFTYNLGDTVAIPDNLFAENPMLWLGIKVGADPEYAPRARLVAAPYAFHALRADTSSTGGGWVDESPNVRLEDSNDNVVIGSLAPSHNAKLEVQTNSGIGIYGINATSDAYGYIGSPEVGIYGESGNYYGVYGSSSNSAGVFGASGFSYGVSGQSGTLYGVYGQGVKGVYGYHSPSQHYGYLGGEYYGVLGKDSVSGIWGGLGSAAAGVYGDASGINNMGAVWGNSQDSGIGVFGSSPWGSGVKGSSSGGNGINGTSSSGYGVYGEGNKGVYGSHSSGNFGYLGGNNEGVYGNSYDEKGVYGYSPSGNGVYGETVSGYGVYGTCDYETDGYAGYFYGRAFISGNLGVGENDPEAKLHVNGAIRLGEGLNEYEIMEESNTDGDPWDSFINSNGISIGNDAGGNRQKFIFADGSGDANIFTIVKSINSGANWSVNFAVEQDGDVGIGTGSPTADLHVVGDICYTGGIGACSDGRYKNDVETIKNAMQTVSNIRGVKYNWRKDEFPEMDFDDASHLGLIAQEVKEVLPEIVMVDEAGYMSIDYGRLTPVLIEAIKDQQKTIDEMEAKLTRIQLLLQRLMEEK